MAKIFNQIGSLTQLVRILKVNGIEGFETMDDIRMFRNNYKKSLKEINKGGYDILKQKIADIQLKHRELSAELSNDIKKRKDLLSDELIGIKKYLRESEESQKFLKKFFFRLRSKKLLKRKNILEHSFEEEVRKPFKRRFEEIGQLQSEISDKENNPEEWVKKYTSNKTKKQEFILSVFVENKFLFYGAVGEEQAMRELSKLPDTYVVINDYQLKFWRPIYNKNNDDKIYSVQIDHVVIGPTGIYLIETKNWSKHSVRNYDLFSPVKQLCRHNFAMFVLLNDAKNIKISSHWGERQISPQNIILLTGYRPNENYKYVKIILIPEIVKYISCRREVFNEKEVNSIADCLNYMSRIYT